MLMIASHIWKVIDQFAHIYTVTCDHWIPVVCSNSYRSLTASAAGTCSVAINPGS